MLSPGEWAALIGLGVSIVGSVWGSAFFLSGKLENHTVRIAQLEKTADRHEALFAHAGGAE